MLRSLYPILLLCSILPHPSLANLDQFPFQLSPLPPRDSLLKLSFSSREALSDALDQQEQLGNDVWYSGLNSTSQKWELILTQQPHNSLSSSLPTSFDHSVETLIPSISSFLAQPSQHPSHLTSLSTNSLANLSQTIDSLDSTIHDTYHPYEGLQEISETFERRWGSDWIKRESLGQTFEGRRIEVIKVSDYRVESPSSWRVTSTVDEDEDEEKLELVGGKKKKNREKETKDKIGIVVYGAQHAREWITTSTILYLVHSLLVNSGSHTIGAEGGDKLTRELLKRVEFTFIPVSNVRPTFHCDQGVHSFITSLSS